MFDIKIRVNYNSAIRQADKLSSAAGRLRTEVNKTNDYLKELKDSWQGENADKLYLKIETTRDELNNAAERLDQIATALKQSAVAYLEAENNKLANAGSTGDI